MSKVAAPLIASTGDTAPVRRAAGAGWPTTILTSLSAGGCTRYAIRVSTLRVAMRRRYRLQVNDFPPLSAFAPEALPRPSAALITVAKSGMLTLTLCRGGN